MYLYVSWSLANFGIEDNDGYDQIDWLPSNDFNSITLTDKAIKALKELGTSTPFNLKYILSIDSDGKDGLDKPYFKEGRIQFNIQVKDGTGCSDTSLYDYKYVNETKPKEDKNKSVGTNDEGDNTSELE